MTDQKMEKRKSFLLNMAYWVVILAIVYFVVKYLINIMMPIFLALVFASISRPIARFLSRDVRYIKGPGGERIAVKRRVHLSSSLAGILSVLLLFLLIAGLLTLLCFRLVDTVGDFVETLPRIYYNSIVPGLERLFANVEVFAARFDDSVLEIVQGALPNLISTVGSAVTSFSATAVTWISSLAGALPSILLSTVICLIATVFTAIDFESIQRFIRRNLPARPLELATDVKNSFLEIIWQFVKSYFIIFCITATEVSVGLLIIGMDRPVLLGVLIALFDAFPIVGSGMILLPWAIITLIAGGGWKGIGLLIVYLVVVIARQIIEPKIVGKHVGLRPLVTLTCMYAGTKIFGGIGLFALPIAAAILTDMNNSGIIHLFKRNEPEHAEDVSLQGETLEEDAPQAEEAQP